MSKSSSKTQLLNQEDIFIKSPIATVIFNSSGDCTFLNEAYARLKSNSREVLLKQNFNQIDSYIKSGLVDEIKQALIDDKPHQREINVQVSSGKQIWVSCHIYSTIIQDKQHIIVQMFDLTDIKRQNIEFQKMTNRLLLATQAAETGTWEWNINSDGFVCDQRMHDFYQSPLQLRNEKMSYNYWRSKFHPDDLAQAEKEFLEALKGNKEFNSEFRIILDDGSIRHIHSVSVTEYDLYGKPISLVGMNRDITKEKKAQNSLLQTNEFLDNLIDNIPQLITVKNAKDLTIVQLNRSAEAAIGRKREEIYGQTAFQLVGTPLAAKVEESDRITLTNQVPLESEFELVEKNGLVRSMKMRKIPMKDKSGNVNFLLGVTEDISEIKNREKALITKQKQIESQNKELEQFAYIASHDLQAPLRHILAFCDFLDKELAAKPNGADALNYSNIISSSAKKMTVLIDDLLNYARIGRASINFSTFPVQSIVNEITQLLRNEIVSSGAIINVNTDIQICADEIKFRQVLQNLIANALKFKRKGVAPIITIELINGPLEWRLSITDNGIGIKPEYYERVFRPFQRLHTDKEYKGTGIGLAICEKIVSLHKGELSVKSDGLSWTTFSFTIPKPIEYKG